MPKDSYVCPHCGFVLPKKDATISGWDSQSSLRHIHCPKCNGTEITWDRGTGRAVCPKDKTLVDNYKIALVKEK